MLEQQKMKLFIHKVNDTQQTGLMLYENFHLFSFTTMEYFPQL